MIGDDSFGEEDIEYQKPAAKLLRKQKNYSVLKKMRGDHPTLLFVFPELWERIRAYFGGQGVFWFRDSPQVIHWKSVSNPLAWDFLLFEWIFAIRNRGNINCDFSERRFNPAEDEDWDFIAKPYIPQGSKWFRRDVRNWIRSGSNSSAGLSNILRKLIVDPRHPECVPESVVLVMKQILAIEQSFEVHTFTELGLMARPPVGADMHEEAEIRLKKLLSLYSPELEQELTSAKYFIPHEAMQNRRGIIKWDSNWKCSNDMNTPFFNNLSRQDPLVSKKEKDLDDGGSSVEKISRKIAKKRKLKKSKFGESDSEDFEVKPSTIKIPMKLLAGTTRAKRPAAQVEKYVESSSSSSEPYLSSSEEDDEIQPFIVEEGKFQYKDYRECIKHVQVCSQRRKLQFKYQI